MGTHCIDTPHTLSQTYLSIGQISELVSEGPVINLFYDIVLITREAYVLVGNLVFFICRLCRIGYKWLESGSGLHSNLGIDLCLDLYIYL